jgi:NitT/TauT family transport system ATP-binding protein
VADAEPANVSTIALQSVAKHYPRPTGDRLRVLEDVTFDMADRSLTSILGPSGCGKSTILNLVAGLDVATSGQVVIDGKIVGNGARPKVGFVFQQPRLLNWRTVADNVALPLEEINLDRSARRSLALKFLRLVGLGDYENYFPLQLSGGMQQRVAIARALAVDPDILLMDEPFSGLDELTARKLRQELIRIWQETEKTILFVTHSISESVFLSQQVVIVSAKPAKVFKRVAIDAPYPRQYGDLRLFEIETSVMRDFLAMENSE